MAMKLFSALTLLDLWLASDRCQDLDVRMRPEWVGLGYLYLLDCRLNSFSTASYWCRVSAAFRWSMDWDWVVGAANEIAYWIGRMISLSSLLIYWWISSLFLFFSVVAFSCRIGIGGRLFAQSIGSIKVRVIVAQGWDGGGGGGGGSQTDTKKTQEI